jgi:hypothetical protein
MRTHGTSPRTRRRETVCTGKSYLNQFNLPLCFYGSNSFWRRLPFSLKQVVELATFLYTGEYVHARHVWRRWKESSPSTFLVDWWKVGAAMMSNDPTTIWQGLAHIQANHPAPLSSYAQEVGIAYRKRILQSFPATQPYLTLLNFSSPQELELFCEQHVYNRPGRATSLNSGLQGTTGLTQVVAFLDSATTSTNIKA